MGNMVSDWESSNQCLMEAMRQDPSGTEKCVVQLSDSIDLLSPMAGDEQLLLLTGAEQSASRPDAKAMILCPESAVLTTTDPPEPQ